MVTSWSLVGSRRKYSVFVGFVRPNPGMMGLLAGTETQSFSSPPLRLHLSVTDGARAGTGAVSDNSLIFRSP